METKVGCLECTSILHFVSNEVEYKRNDDGTTKAIFIQTRACECGNTFEFKDEINIPDMYDN